MGLRTQEMDMIRICSEQGRVLKVCVRVAASQEGAQEGQGPKERLLLQSTYKALKL